ncbi:MAG: diguanylate cyclase [bacterium]|nr:diguanylate cyclase [bacterium]
MYQFNIHVAPLFFTFILMVVLGVFVLLGNSRNLSHKYFFSICMSTSVWLFGTSMGYISTTATQACFWFKISTLGVVFIPVFFLGVVADQTNKKLTKIIFSGIAFALSFAILNISNSYLISDVRLFYWGYFPKWNLVNSLPFFIFWFSYATMSLVILKKSIVSAVSIKKKIRLRFLLIVFLMIYFSSIDYLPAFGLEVYPFGFIPTCIFLFISAYAIFKYQLMDIDLVMDIDLACRKFLRDILFFLVSLLFFGIFAFFLDKINRFLPLINTLISVSIIIVTYRLYSTKLLNFIENLLLYRYNKTWNKLKIIVENQDNQYSMKDIVKVVMDDVANALNIRESQYYCLVKGDYVSFFDQNNAKNSKCLPQILIHHLIKNKSFIYIHYLDENYQELKRFLEVENIDLCYPIFFANSLAGIVTYSNKKDNSVYYSEDLGLLSGIMANIEHQIAFLTHTENIAHKNAEKALSDYKLKHQNQILTAIKYLSETKDIDDFHHQIVALINRYLNSKYTAIYLYDDQTNSYFCKALRQEGGELSSDRIEEENYLIKYLKQRKEIILFHSIQRSLEGEKTIDFKESGITTKCKNLELIVPLIDMDSLLGFIVIGKPKEKDRYSENMLTMLLFISDRVQITLSNILIKQQVDRDELTGLYTRGFLKRRLEEETRNSMETGNALSVLMIDIDDFKWFNDNHGYDVGDLVITSVVNAIKLVTRPTDEFCRFGGEEFPVIAVGADSQEADIVSARILQAVRTNKDLKKLADKYQRKISVSIGVGSFKPDFAVKQFSNKDVEVALTHLTKVANNSLKEAKKNGKDQACHGVNFSGSDDPDYLDFFAMKILFVSNNQKFLAGLEMDGVDIETNNALDSSLKKCSAYDIVILDIQEESQNIKEIVKKFRKKSRDILIAIISPCPKHQGIATGSGAKFFLSPLNLSDLKAWIGYLKNMS